MIAAASASSATALAQVATATLKAAADQASKTAADRAADAKLQAMRDTVPKLKAAAANASGSATTASMAKAKLDALKERLKMLMMMGGDPKTVAKEAAQIAKEIGKAAKDYADASGGSDSSGSSAAAEASSDAASAQQAASSAAGAGGQAAANPDAAAAAAPTAAAPTPDAAKTDAPKTDAPKDPADPGSADPTQTHDPAKTKTPSTPQVTVKTTNAIVAGKAKLPDPVIEEARALEASAQAIAKAALQKLKAQHKLNPDAKKEQDQLDQGQKDFTAAAKEIYGDTGEPSDTSGGGYSAQAQPVAAPPPAAPAVSVQA